MGAQVFWWQQGLPVRAVSEPRREAAAAAPCVPPVQPLQAQHQRGQAGRARVSTASPGVPYGSTEQPCLGEPAGARSLLERPTS